MFPDYSIYPDVDYAIGFLTRGCIRKCPWCVVPKKEGMIHPYRTWQEIKRPDSKKIVFMDNNVLACPHGIEQMKDMVGKKVWVDFNQGLDARLVTDEIAEILARLRWIYGEIVSVDGSGFCYAPIPGLCTKLKCSGCQRTGCIFCGFGAHLEKGETRFQRLARTHPKQYEYCMGGGQWVDNPEYDPTAPKMDGDWQNWNPKKIWVPSKQGLGMKHVFDECNAIYGKDFIRYE